ncbi:MAG TPA: hypothetical protein VGH38_00655 [Bryobacteraceae bacterium]|jgi:hypothetical protein
MIEKAAADVPRGRKLAVAALLVTYFFAVSWDGLKATFAADDMLAIYMYWHPSPLRFAVSHFLLWRGYFRPMVGFFYLPIFARYGLNPFPYHVVLLLLLLAGAWMMYRFARAMGCAEVAAAVVALIACYHYGMANLYFNAVYVGDVLCGLFYFAAFGLYARIRSTGRLLTGRQTAAFLGLYLCALNSKEMAVTLPLLLLVYEWLYHGPPPGRSWQELAQWLRGPGRGVCWAGLLDAVSVYGKAFGNYGLMHNPAYRPVFSLARLVDFEERYLADIFGLVDRPALPATLSIWLVVTYFAWRRPRPLLRFCWFYVLITPIPIQFLDGRGQANLYVTLAGWAMFAGTLFADSLPALARVLDAEPLFRRLGRQRLYALLAALGMLLLAWRTWTYEKTWIVLAIPQLSPITDQVIKEFYALNPRVRPHAKVVILEDPWPDGFDMEFIGELWFRDRKTQVILNQKQPQSEEEIAHADAVLTWRDGKLISVR